MFGMSLSDVDGRVEGRWTWHLATYASFKKTSLTDERTDTRRMDEIAVLSCMWWMVRATLYVWYLPISKPQRRNRTVDINSIANGLMPKITVGRSRLK